MSHTADDLELLLGALQANSAEWRRPGRPGALPSLATQAAYLQAVLDTEALLMRLAPEKAGHLLVDGALAERLLSVAMEHAALGQLPWITVQAWLRVLDTVLDVVERQHHSLAHVVLRVWESVRRMARDHYQRTYPAAAVCATLSIAEVLMAHSPIEVRDVYRKDLPHPVKNASLPVRVCGLRLAPLVVANLGQPPPHNSGGAAQLAIGPVLNADFYEYLRKGLTSGEYVVREAAVEAVRRTLELGVLLDAYTAPTLLELLLTTAKDRYLNSAKLEADAAVAIGYVLRLYQTDAVVGKPVCTTAAAAAAATGTAGTGSSSPSPSSPSGMWAYFGATTAPEAARVIRALFRPDGMSSSLQAVLASSMATLLWLCCPSPAAVRPALRAMFVLLVPVEGDTRAYMPKLLADAVAQYANRQPSHSHRVELLRCLCDYVRRTDEDRVIAHTALIAAEAIVPLLASSRELVGTLGRDMLRALAAQPGPLMTVVASVEAHMALQSAHSRRTLLAKFVSASHQAAEAEAEAETEKKKSGNSATCLLRFPTDLVFALKAILTADTVEEKARPSDSSPRERERDEQRAFLGDEFTAPLLAFTIRLAAVVSGGAGSPVPHASDARDQRIEYFYLLASLLGRRCPRSISTFMKDKIALAAHQFATTLVNAPAATAVCRRAMCNACAYFLDTEAAVTDTQRSLCIGFLEGQLQQEHNGGGGDDPSSAAAVALTRLKGKVYRVVRNSGAWSECNDPGSLKWLVTQALKDIQHACDSGTPLPLSADEVFPSSASHFMAASQRIVPSAGQAVAAETAKQAALLVGHAVAAMAQGNLLFCRDVLKRVHQWLTSANAALAASSPGAAGPGSTSHDGGGDSHKELMARLWTVLVVVKAMLDSAAGSPAPVQELWAKDFREFTQPWEETVKSWCVVAPSLDLRVLGAKVLGGMVCLAKTVDAHTTRIVVTQQPALVSTASVDAVTTAAILSLPLVEAHAMYARILGGPAATLPMAVSYTADILRRCSPLGDPCTGPALLILLSCIRLVEAYPADARDTVASSTLHAILVPDPPAVDPLVRSLVLVLLAPPSPRDTTASGGAACTRDARTPQGMHALASACVRRTVAAHHHQQFSFMPEAQAAELRLVGTVLRSWERHDETAFPEKNAICRLLLDRLLAVSRPPRHPLPDSVSIALADLWLQCRAEAAPPPGDVLEPLGIVPLASFTDAATSPAARDAWKRVGAQLVERALVSASPRDSVSLLRVVKALQAVLQARSPNLSLSEVAVAASSSSSGGGGGGGGGGTHRNAAAGGRNGAADNEGDEDGSDHENMLDIVKDDPHRNPRSRGTKRRTGALNSSRAGGHVVEGEGEVPDCAWSDIAAKKLAFQLLLQVVECGWGRVVDNGSDTGATALSACPVRASILDLMVVAVPLVGATPELLPDATNALLATLVKLQACDTPAAVLPWKAALAAATKTVVELSPFHTERLVALLDAFSEGPLAEDSSMTRLTRGLVVLLATLDQLANEHQSSATPSLAASHVAVALCHVLASASKPAEADGRAGNNGARWPQTQVAAARGARSACGQAALATLCARLLTTVAVTSGFEPPSGLLAPATADTRLPNEDIDGDGAIDAGAVLHAVGTAWSATHGGTALGPSLRYAVGCLACLVAATDGSDVAPLAAIAPLLSTTHQSILTQITFKSLVDEGPVPLPGDTESHLLAVAASATIAGGGGGGGGGRAAIELAESLLIRRGGPMAVEDAGSLLCVLLQCVKGDMPEVLSRVVRHVTVDYLCVAPRQLFAAAATFLLSLPDALREPFASLSTSAFLLCERAAVSTARAAAAGPKLSLLRQARLSGEAARLLLACFAEAEDPFRLVSCLVGEADADTASVGTASAAPLLLLRILAILGSCTDADALVRFGPVVRHLFAKLLLSGRDNIRPATHLLLELLCCGEDEGDAPAESALTQRLVLRPVGALLVHEVAKTYPQDMKAVIQSLPPERVAVLRRFMEESATTAPAHHHR